MVVFFSSLKLNVINKTQSFRICHMIHWDLFVEFRTLLLPGWLQAEKHIKTKVSSWLHRHSRGKSLNDNKSHSLGKSVYIYLKKNCFLSIDFDEFRQVNDACVFSGEIDVEDCFLKGYTQLILPLSNHQNNGLHILRKFVLMWRQIIVFEVCFCSWEFTRSVM